MIRVLRVLEYEYETVERMQHDMEHWTTTTPHGARGMSMQSATVSIRASEGEPFVEIIGEPFITGLGTHSEE